MNVSSKKEKPIANTESRCRLAASETIFDQLLHDLKQPLNLIRVVAQDLKLDCKRDRLDVSLIPESMVEIERAIDTVVRQIDSLRGFVHPSDKGRVDAEADVNGACRAAIGRIKHMYPEVEIEAKCGAELPPVSMDPFLLEQALVEILRNAALAAVESSSGKPDVVLEAMQRDKGVVVRVSDNGQGVLERDCATLVKPFFTTREGASGLGLTLAFGVVKQVGGRVELLENKGNGASFEAWLPLET